ncbi:MAG: signal recognition particle receptor subunit alpha [Candidatus Marsarchaeota archaeon]|jgi:signal recognition particle subunit SRP54|nr:signal recognition particle receptor subunit alpha [Candidatus Marsarchaeota archaeon]MCL5418665.1 signal recognition particle receptor subunit alpha [Candidatus Marsarchaeota archaeon]
MDLGEGLRQAIAKLTRATIIDAKTIKEFNKELQKVLLSSDVDVKLVFEFTKNIEEKALKSKPPAGLSPHDYITNIVYDELVKLVGSTYEPEMKRRRILLAGLYGSGKTTTAAKLGKFYQDRGLSAALICCDVSRPAAYEQLKTLAEQAGVPFFGIPGEKDPVKIVKQALEKFNDKAVLICDTSGRNALDSKLVTELKGISSSFKPDEKILVISADIGQVAGTQAHEFNESIGISGIIVTKMDGSGKGGGALSAANASGAKVMFIGTGEKLANIEPFNAEKFIGGLLGVPDIAGLVEHVQQAVKEAALKPEEVEMEKLNFDSFYAQLKAMGKMGPLKNVFGMMGAPDVPNELVEQSEEKLKKYKVIIGSMTERERKDEHLLHESGRIKRIANGSGTTEKDVHSLISDFNKMKKMFDMFKNDRNFRKRFSKLGV